MFICQGLNYLCFFIVTLVTLVDPAKVYSVLFTVLHCTAVCSVVLCSVGM